MLNALRINALSSIKRLYVSQIGLNLLLFTGIEETNCNTSDCKYK